MAKYLRKISQSKWTSKIRGQLGGDCLSDLKCSGNILSFWKIDNDAQLELVVTALALNVDKIDKVDYAIISESELKSIGVSIVNSPGDTPYPEANPLHVNITNLSIVDVTGLAIAINRCKEMKRILKPDVLKLLNKSKDKFLKSQVSSGISQIIYKN